MLDERVAPIGGYFELELPRGALPHQGSVLLQSARAAFLALLRAGKPGRVWMPRYICDAMHAPLRMAGIDCVWYDVDERLAVDDRVKIETGDWLLYVNYFGLCEQNVATLMRRFPPSQIVLDYSQAFFSASGDEALATIYSPRKFFGVPDGGMLYSRIPLDLPKYQDEESIFRSSHLIKRLADSPESGYADYQKAEENLAECEPKRMSKLTERILASVMFESARKKRRDNFLFLQERLGAKNRFACELSEEEVPLCYPFQTDEPELRARLINNRIFVATYWPDAIGRVGDEWAEKMIKNFLPLPIDQRYGLEDMERMVSLIMGKKK